jgi:alpha-beta hydrolase superfamily lysophospholipase
MHMSLHSIRLLVLVLATVLLSEPVAPKVDAGGVPISEPIRSDWQSLLIARDGDIMEALVRIPQDANALGVRAAHLRTKDYPTAFQATSVHAADGTPLAGMMARYADDRNRPGVVLVPGMTQTKDLKFMVELAELFARNGWHVLTIDPRGHGESRSLSPALSSMGWKETQDVLGAVRHLRERTRPSSVAVMGFSQGGRSLVKAMAEDEGRVVAAGIAVTAPLGPYPSTAPPDPGRTPGRFERFVLDFFGARSLYDYYDRAARSYGVDLRTMEKLSGADTSVARVKKPLLMLYALDDFLLKLAIRAGRHDGGAFSLAYRDTVPDHPHVRTMLVDQGNHAGMLYLSDPHWFALVTLSYLKYWQARDLAYVTAAAPPLDVLADGQLDGRTATYRLSVRNHGPNAVGVVDVHLQIPSAARLESCWVGFEGLGRCTVTGHHVSWTMPRLAGSKATAGPFVAVLDVSRLKPGAFTVRTWITAADGGGESFDESNAAAAPQSVTLDKP